MDLELVADIEKIAMEYKECEGTRSQQLEEFRKYIQDQNDCQSHRTDDKYLMKFLRSRNWRIPSAYRLVNLL